MQLLQAFNTGEQEKCKTSEGLFEVRYKKIQPHHNKTILSLQYCKLKREESGSAEEHMGWL